MRKIVCSETKLFLLLSILSLTLVLLLSCSGFEQEMIPMSVKVENIEDILVINSEIEKDSTVWVDLSYVEDIDALITTPIKYENNASVLLSTGSGAGEQLSFLSNGRYEGSILKGAVGETYTLTVTIGTQTYSGSSTMLQSYGYDTAWIVGGKVSTGKGKGGSFFSYSDEWRINDPSATRDRYLFEWWTNGVHIILRDWAIDDNRVVNANEGLRLFTVTMDPGPNERVRHRTARIEKLTYDYYNMYEKIVNKLIGVSSQTPYNPVSNFGEGTIGNFRAVDFDEYYLLTPPAMTSQRGDMVNELHWTDANKEFVNFHLYWDTKPDVTVQSNVISDIKTTSFTHSNLTNGIAYYYKLQVEGMLGYRSCFSPEVSQTPTDSILPPAVSASGDSGSVILTWTPHTKAASNTIYWGTETGVTAQSNAIPNVTGTSYTHANLTNGTVYYYAMTSTDSLGIISALSTEVKATAGGDGPQNVVATPGAGQIVLTWDVIKGAAAYGVFADTSSGITEKSTELSGGKLTTNSFTHTSLTTGTTWYYKIGAWVETSKGKYELFLSKEVSATVGKE